MANRRAFYDTRRHSTARPLLETKRGDCVKVHVDDRDRRHSRGVERLLVNLEPGREQPKLKLKSIIM